MPEEPRDAHAHESVLTVVRASVRDVTGCLWRTTRLLKTDFLHYMRLSLVGLRSLMVAEGDQVTRVSRHRFGCLAIPYQPLIPVSLIPAS